MLSLIGFLVFLKVLLLAIGLIFSPLGLLLLVWLLFLLVVRLLVLVVGLVGTLFLVVLVLFPLLGGVLFLRSVGLCLIMLLELLFPLIAGLLRFVCLFGLLFFGLLLGFLMSISLEVLSLWRFVVFGRYMMSLCRIFLLLSGRIFALLFLTVMFLLLGGLVVFR